METSLIFLLLFSDLSLSSNNLENNESGSKKEDESGGMDGLRRVSNFLLSLVFYFI